MTPGEYSRLLIRRERELRQRRLLAQARTVDVPALVRHLVWAAVLVGGVVFGWAFVAAVLR